MIIRKILNVPSDFQLLFDIETAMPLIWMEIIIIQSDCIMYIYIYIYINNEENDVYREMTHYIYFGTCYTEPAIHKAFRDDTKYQMLNYIQNIRNYNAITTHWQSNSAFVQKYNNTR